MQLSSMMASQLQSLQSVMKMSILNNALNMNKAAATEMLESLPAQQPTVAHPHKGAFIDMKA